MFEKVFSLNLLNTCRIRQQQDPYVHLQCKSELNTTYLIHPWHGESVHARTQREVTLCAFSSHQTCELSHLTPVASDSTDLHGTTAVSSLTSDSSTGQDLKASHIW